MAGAFSTRLPWVGRPRGRVAARLDNLERGQWWPPERIATAQARRLRRFLVDMGRHHPALRDRFAEARFRSELITSAGSLAGLPLVDPPADGGDGPEAEATAWQQAAVARARRWWGVEPADAVLTVAGDGGHLDPILDALFGRRPPRSVAAHGETLLRLAHRATERRLSPAKIPLLALFAPVGSLDEAGREAVEACLGGPVALYLDLPGIGLIAHGCPEGGLHLCADHLVVEVVKPSTGRPVKAGEEGEVAVTDTSRRRDPVVRCRTAIRARLATAPCLCGRGLPLFTGVAPI